MTKKEMAKQIIECGGCENTIINNCHHCPFQRECDVLYITSKGLDPSPREASTKLAKEYTESLQEEEIQKTRVYFISFVAYRLHNSAMSNCTMELDYEIKNMLHIRNAEEDVLKMAQNEDPGINRIVMINWKEIESVKGEE